VSADDHAVLPAGDDGLDEAELAEAPLQGVELRVGDPAWVGWVWPELVDRDLLDGDGGGLCGACPRRY